MARATVTGPRLPFPPAGGAAPGNHDIAALLDEVGELLETQEAQPFRAQAYRRAADAIRALPQSLAATVRAGGADAVARLPGLGSGLARVITEIVYSGRLGLLDWLRGHADPERLLATVPGLGPELASRVHERLGVHTLEDLELAAHDGRLARVPGFGGRRVRAVIETLAGRLARPRPPAGRAAADPPIDELLDVDREYREKAEAGLLRRIAPRRFNPRRRAWLPILHTERNGRHYTALYSNTARAHQLGKTDDWVVIFVDDGGSHRQATVVTETHGSLDGERVVRGRERECLGRYRKAS
jgi:DNA polymerase (family 10)